MRVSWRYHRLPNTACVSFAGVKANELMDIIRHHVACSAGAYVRCYLLSGQHGLLNSVHRVPLLMQGLPRRHRFVTYHQSEYEYVL